MKEDWLEDKLKKELGDFSSGLNMEQEWKALASRRAAPKRKRRGAFWWWGSVGLFLLMVTVLSIASLFLFPKTKHLSISKRSSNSQTLASIPSEMIAHHFANADQLISNKKTNSAVSPLASFTNKNNAPTPSTKTITTAKHTTINTSNLTKNNTSINTNSKHKKPILIQTNIASSEPAKENSSQKMLHFTPRLPLILPSLSPQETINLPAVIAQNITSSNLEKKLENNPDKNHQVSKWAVGLYVQYGKNERQLHRMGLLDNGIDQRYLERRNASEIALDASQYELSIRRNLGERFFLQLGLGYGVATDKFTDTYEEDYSQNVANQVVVIHRFEDGAEDYVYGTTTSQTFEMAEIVSYHRTKTTYSQLVAGVKFPFHEKVGLALSGGVNYALNIQKTGKTHYDFQSPGDYRTLASLPYRTSGIWQGLLSAECYYAFHEKWEVDLGFTTNFYLNNAFKNYGFFVEKRQVFGGQIGVRRTF